MRVFRTFLPIALALGAVVASAGPASADPAVTVTPSTGLVDFQPVMVEATGLPVGTTVFVTECDTFYDFVDVVGNCPNIGSADVGSSGEIAVTVYARNFVTKDFEFGARFLPVYCRADICRMWVWWADADGTVHSVGSEPLEFVGSPATITASPSTDLVDGQKVKVSGTAFGAEGHIVLVVEEACYSIIQDAGCYGTRVIASTTVRSDGTWTVKKVRAHRFLTDGTDCADADNILGVCQFTARVLADNGQPDDSFGVASLGDPGAVLSFRR